MSRLRAGTVLYAVDIERVAAFYAGVLDMDIGHAESNYIVLNAPGYELVIQRVPAQIAATIAIDTPPRPRENTAIKPVFFVPSLANARTVAACLGGVLPPPEAEWRFGDFVVCDGVDPEGNVVQFRAGTPDT
ncbi:VOC family protein [Jeongeupia chitinilytica]|uniref:Glyoxalase-like domain-containing protein n=1 Tax=Jeongeupia chitinilytica TaxID=1041641 RepID=A0ABQ3H1M5_9NEIS|nr:VOC family protein [Jeongeupia chitinilytica]GHD64231.1 hypothetical protein GCM10007350_22850 [Jeongeupia chitinilytica]